MKKRVIVLDYLRGIASLSVAYGHLNSSYNPTGFVTAKFLNYEFSWHLAYIGVHIFFLISGFVVPIAYKNDITIKKFFIKRIFRLYPSYIIALITTLLVINLVAIEPPILPSAFMANLFFVQDLLGYKTVLPVTWTLLIEWKFYLLVPILCCSKIKSILTYSICSTFVFSWCLISPDLISYIYKKCNVLGVFLSIINDQSPWLLVVLLGSVLAKFYLKIWSKKTGFIICIVTIIAVLFAFYRLYLKYFPDHTTLIHIHSFFWAFIIFNLFYILRTNITYIPLLKWLGDISYSLYVIHICLGGHMLIFLLHYIPYYPMFAVFIALCCSLFVSHFMYSLIEVKSMRWAKKLTGG